MTPEERAEARRLAGQAARDREDGCDCAECRLASATRAALDALEAAEREVSRLRAAYDAYTDAGLRADLRIAEGWIKTATFERDAARAQVATLAEALRWYAEDNSYKDRSFKEDGVFKSTIPALKDAGNRARATLKEAGIEILEPSQIEYNPDDVKANP